MIKIIRHFFTGILVLFVSSCATGYEIGEDFKVELEKNGAGGYQWEYVQISEVIVIDSIETKMLQENQLNEYVKVYTMQGRQKGSFELSFHKKRSFEPDSLILPENIKKVKVRIIK